MSLVGDFIEPYKFWLELAFAVALVGGGAVAGNAARGHWDAGDIAKAHAAVDKAQGATKAANAERDQWRDAAQKWEKAIGEQNAANAQAQAEAAHDAVLATQAIEHAAVAEQSYLRRRREIDAAAANDTSACALTRITGSPLQ